MQQWLFNNSSNETIFNEATLLYEKVQSKQENKSKKKKYYSIYYRVKMWSRKLVITFSNY